ncbi:MAG TPA: 3-oxoacyl-[acyl-carrier-protein] reductase, partial [Desulfobacterales bacterium]|nr:3-oxoacyl-[acyl-carrier-protein] reductase [Desulfobacterales bacterium]
MTMLLTGKTAIVTGGSRGIGNAIVAEFLREGATVYAFSRTGADNQAELEVLAAAAGGAVRWKNVDVTDEDAFGKALEAVLAEAGAVHVLVNNAGITRDGLVFRMPTADWDAVLRANLTSAFFACRIVARAMVKQRAGSIVNISSVSGIMGNAGQTNYAASKAGLIGFSKSLAREVATRGVRVNAIAPGFIETDMTRGLGEKVRAAFLAQIPLGRMGTAGEVAALAAFLASDRSSYVTGQVIP